MGHREQQQGSFCLAQGSAAGTFFCARQDKGLKETRLPHGPAQLPSAGGEKGHGAEAGIQAINPLFKE